MRRWKGMSQNISPNTSTQTTKESKDLFGEWMDSIEHLDAYVTDKPTDMEISEI